MVASPPGNIGSFAYTDPQKYAEGAAFQETRLY
jgi:hypothetical protein